MKIGSLFSGIGGLDLAVERAFGATTSWQVEYEEAPASILARHWPDADRFGDVTEIDWQEMEPVDVICGGYPCQPFSHAGLRKGTNDVRHLWPYFADAIGVLRPRFAVLENVAGHLSLGFDRVLGDLAEIGYDATWVTLRAADIGAPHGRKRLFCLATDAEGDDGRAGFIGWPGSAIGSQGHDEPAWLREGSSADASGERHGRGENSRMVGGLDSGSAGEARQRQRPRSESGYRGSETLPDPYESRLQGAQPAQRCNLFAGGVGSTANTDDIGFQRTWSARDGWSGLEDHSAVDWGTYGAAIRRWEAVLGRAAPVPAIDGKLNARFVEWMMGFDEGWVDGLSRTKALKALGNAVVPQQGEVALRALIGRLEMEIAA